MDIAIIGTVGVPAKYGGFETLVENILQYSQKNNNYTVVCSSHKIFIKPLIYKDANLLYIPLKANGVWSVLYDIISLIKVSYSHDIILILGVSGCSFLPIYRLFTRNKKLIVNIDGLEHKRNKWNRITKAFLLFSEQMAIKYANIIISDNKGIQNYVKDQYEIDSSLITYGGDHALVKISLEEQNQIMNTYSLIDTNYSFSVCRIEPENNIHIILEAFRTSKKNLVFVGNWNKSEYGKKILFEYSTDSNIQLLSPIYDVKTLFALRNNCIYYIHGHSAGGTNPSLVEAMFFGKPILAFDVIYNRETTENKADYFSSSADLVDLLNSPYPDFQLNGKNMLEIANRRYKWSIITKQYEDLFHISNS